MSDLRACPKCGGAPYVYHSRQTAHGAALICKACAHHYSTTSRTVRHATKLAPEKWDAIEALMLAGTSGLQISKQLRIEYKTVWLTMKRLRIEYAQP